MIYQNGMNFTIIVGLLAIQPTDTAAILRIFYGTDVRMSTV
jgi:hypothetical protein